MKTIFITDICNDDSLALYSPAVGTPLLATILKNGGCEVEIISVSYLFHIGFLKKEDSQETNIKKISEYVLEKKPGIVGFYCIAEYYHIATGIAKKIKEDESSVHIVFGGPQASLVAEESLKTFPFIDVVALGEGEKIILKIVDALDGKLPLSSVSGIAWREDGGIKKNGKVDVYNNLDNLPYTDYTLLPNFKELSKITIDVGRGCPFWCTFCTAPLKKGGVRMKSNKRIIEEIKDLYYSHNKDNFWIANDTFTTSKERVLEFCNLLMKEKMNVVWDCFSRCDTLDKEMMYS